MEAGKGVPTGAMAQRYVSGVRGMERRWRRRRTTHLTGQATGWVV